MPPVTFNIGMKPLGELVLWGFGLLVDPHLCLTTPPFLKGAMEPLNCCLDRRKLKPDEMKGLGCMPMPDRHPQGVCWSLACASGPRPAANVQGPAVAGRERRDSQLRLGHQLPPCPDQQALAMVPYVLATFSQAVTRSTWSGP